MINNTNAITNGANTHVRWLSPYLACCAMALAGVLGGCSVGQVYDTVQGVRSATNTYYTAKNVKDLTDDEAPPLFAGIQGVAVYTQIAPRKSEAEVSAHFQQAIVAALADELSLFQAPVRVCVQRAACTGRTVEIRYRRSRNHGCP